MRKTIKEIVAVRTWDTTVLDEYDIISARILLPNGVTQTEFLPDIIRNVDENLDQYFFSDKDGIKTSIEVVHPSYKYKFPYILSDREKCTPENLLSLPRF